MSQRVGPPAGVAHPSNEAASPSSPRSAYRPWEEVYPALPPVTQVELCTLAQTQGFLLAEQIPAPPCDHVRQTLHDALSHALAPLPLLPAEPSPTLDVNQGDALQRLWHTPDLGVVLGAPGTGKRRVAFELIARAIAAGERVLLLASDASSVDAHLATLAALPGSQLTRFVGAHENAAQMPPDVYSFTPNAQEQALAQRLTEQANREQTAAEAALQAAEQEQQMWRDAEATLQDHARVKEELAQIAERCAGLAAEIEHDAQTTATEAVPYFVQRLRGAQASYEKRLGPLTSEATTLANERAVATTQVQSLEHAANELRQKVALLANGSVFSPSYWSARMDKGLAGRLAEAEAALATAQQRLADLAIRDDKLAATRKQYDDDYQTERAKLLADEHQRRSTVLQANDHDTHQRLAATVERLGTLATALGQAELSLELCATMTPHAEATRTAATQRVATVREWQTLLPSLIASQATHAKAHMNVVVGPIEIFGDPTLSGTVFDWLVVDGAHAMSEATFLAAARKARRWALFGEGLCVGHGPHLTVGKQTRGEFFQRLTVALRTPVWEYDDHRLVCRLFPVPPSDRRSLECEPVADSPEIELRVYNTPNGEPQLAEVAFPASTSPATAREYLFHELQEVTAQPAQQVAQWSADATSIVVRFSAATTVAFAELGDGIREELDGLDTVALHFALDAGWTHERAEGWATEHLTKRSSGRCAVLHHPYRACPGLAKWLNTAFGMAYRVPSVTDVPPHVEFLAVPERERRSRDVGRAHRVGGAGYEIDLSDSKQRASLPTDLVSALPTTGWVNLHEAQAIIRHLEASAGNYAVTAPFPGQVALIRLLAQQTPRLRLVKFFTAADAEYVECEQLIVSLTRSHVARAVTFGESPQVLAKLLGRVRRQVLFVGDPGTLARRLQWEGPVDHLNAVDAAREHRWIAALADCPRVSPPRHRSPAESVRV